MKICKKCKQKFDREPLEHGRYYIPKGMTKEIIIPCEGSF